LAQGWVRLCKSGEGCPLEHLLMFDVGSDTVQVLCPTSSSEKAMRVVRKQDLYTKKDREGSEWVSGICTSRCWLKPQNYERQSTATSFMNLETDAFGSWLRDPLTGVWFKKKQGGGRKFQPTNSGLTMILQKESDMGMKKSVSAPIIPDEAMFMTNRDSYGTRWGRSRSLADWRLSSDKKMFDSRASGPRVL